MTNIVRVSEHSCCFEYTFTHSEKKTKTCVFLAQPHRKSYRPDQNRKMSVGDKIRDQSRICKAHFDRTQTNNITAVQLCVQVHLVLLEIFAQYVTYMRSVEFIICVCTTIIIVRICVDTKAEVSCLIDVHIPACE